MIKNLDLTTLMMPKAANNAPNEGTDALMALLGQGNDLGLSQEEITKLLAGNNETSAVNFESLLKSTESQPELLPENAENNLLNLNSSEFELSPKEALNLKEQLVKSGLLEQEGQLSLDKLEKVIDEKPELKNLLQRIVKLNKENAAQNKVFSQLTNLVPKVLSNKEAATVNNIAEKAQNVAKLQSNLAEFDTLKKNSITKANSVNKAELLKNISKIAPNKNIITKNDNAEAAVNTEATPAVKKFSGIADFMMSQETEQDMSQGQDRSAFQTITKIATPKAAAPVMDMSSLGTVNLDNQEEVISQIKNYIVQSKVANEQSVQMKFNHHDLGLIDLNVSKAGGDSLAVAINAQTAEAVKFFSEHQRELIQTLNNSGLQISDFKLDTSSNTNSKDFNSNEQSLAEKNKDQSQSKQNENEKESQRRKEIWELFDKEIA